MGMMNKINGYIQNTNDIYNKCDILSLALQAFPSVLPPFSGYKSLKAIKLSCQSKRPSKHTISIAINFQCCHYKL